MAEHDPPHVLVQGEIRSHDTLWGVENLKKLAEFFKNGLRFI